MKLEVIIDGKSKIYHVPSSGDVTLKIRKGMITKVLKTIAIADDK